MKRTIPVLAALAAAFLPVAAGADELAAAWTRFLRVHVRGGLVDYAAVAADPARLEALGEAFAAAPATDDPGFWIDAYNFLAIRLVAEHYPVESPRVIPGFFDRIEHDVAGRWLTLNEIENDVLRPGGDARIHFALVCAERSCTPLRDTAWAGEDPDPALEAVTRRALADPRFVSVEGDGILLSRIFAWYDDDFAAEPGGLRGFLLRYQPDLPDGRVRYREYDWALNDTRVPEAGRARPRRDLAFDSPAALLVPGETELKTFHNVYSQTAFFDDSGDRTDLGARQTWYTGELDVRRGLSPRVNARLDLFWKSVKDGTRPAGDDSRTELTALAPRVQVAPFRRAPSVVTEIGVEIPLAEDLNGAAGGPFLDYGEPVITLRVQHDRFHAPRIYGYYEVGARFRLGETDNRQITTPIKAIGHWLPKQWLTLTLPLEIAPQWIGDAAGSFYTQVGIGAKLRPAPNFEIETIVTVFPFGRNAGAGGTVNLGLRWVL